MSKKIIYMIIVFAAICFLFGCNQSNNKNHNFSDKWTKNEHFHWHECVDCSEGKDKQEHTFSYKYDNYSHHQECICGYMLEDESHEWDSGTILLEPTATTEGKMKYTCPICGATKEEVLESYLEFELNDNKSYSISARYRKILTDSIVIPATYNGLPVTKIADRAFYNKSSIKSITLPDSIIEIGFSSFDGCLNLESINIPNNVKTIGPYAFAHDALLKEIILPANLEILDEGAFLDCSGLISVTINNKLYELSGRLFEDCISLKRLDIPTNITEINENTFDERADIDIYYKGTIANWNKIISNDYGILLTRFKLGLYVHCSDGNLYNYLLSSSYDSSQGLSKVPVLWVWGTNVSGMYIYPKFVSWSDRQITHYSVNFQIDGFVLVECSNSGSNMDGNTSFDSAKNISYKSKDLKFTNYYCEFNK